MYAKLTFISLTALTILVTKPLVKKNGVLLVNLGTPDSPQPKDVGSYLREFLMDPYVVDISAWARWLLVNVAIVPKRGTASARLYQKIWTEAGSPLLVHTKELGKKVAELLGAETPLEIAMRYGNPSLESSIDKLLAQGIERLTVFPLYPQYSLAATESSVARVREILELRKWTGETRYLPAFYDSQEYLNAVTEVSAPFVKKKPFDLVLFSFHGLPERQIKKTDLTGSHCLTSDICCDMSVKANENCYRYQCFTTARLLAQRLNINPLRYSVCFQSRLGRTPWIKPYTDHFYETLPSRGIKRLLVLCPSFVADCLETLEEVAIRGLDQFRKAGGEDLTLVPSLNSTDVWVKAVAKMVS